MNSGDSSNHSVPGLVGLVDVGGCLDADRATVPLGRALGPGSLAVIHPHLAIAQSGGCVYRRGSLACAFLGRLANRNSLAKVAGCPPDATYAELAATAFSRLGDRAIGQFRGEFIVVFWDETAGAGIVARDQLGGRSVFVHSLAKRLTFASDVKLILRMLPSRPGVDQIGLGHWLVLGGTLEGRTLHSGVRRLPIGSLLRFDRRGWSEERYWHPCYSRPMKISRDDAAIELYSALRRSVSSRLEAGSAVGILLSGGLDSSTVAAVASEVLSERDQDLVGYSMTFPNHSDIDESRLMESVTAQLGMPSVHMRVPGGGSMLIGGLEYLRTWEMPTPSPNIVLATELHRCAVRMGTTSLLTGEGGDELFGHDRFLPATHLRRGQLLAAWRLCRRLPGLGPEPSPRQVRRAFRVLALRGAVPYWLQRKRRAMRNPRELVPEWLAPAIATSFADSHDPWMWKRSSAPLWWAHLSDILTNSRETLWVSDTLRLIGLLSGVELAHPLLDLDLVELVLRLPPQYAYDPHFNRALVRHSMKGRLPEAVRVRSRKSHFTSLMAQSLFHDDLPVLRRLLSARDAEIRAFVQPQILSELLEGSTTAAGAAQFGVEAWRLAMAECWLRSQVHPTFADDLIASTRFQPLGAQFSIACQESRPAQTLVR